jgi:RNA polymerase sigma-70 factor (ECF subfamily)
MNASVYAHEDCWLAMMTSENSVRFSGHRVFTGYRGTLVGLVTFHCASHGGQMSAATTEGGAEMEPDVEAAMRELDGDLAGGDVAVRDLASGDLAWVPPTWEEVVRQHSARVYRLAYRLTGDVHDAEDLTQEVFVRVFRSLSSYTPGTFEGWLHRITTNLFLDLVRRRARIRFETLAEDAPERLPGREPTPAQAYDDAHFDDDIQRALDNLAPEFRAAVVLCDIEGLSYEEIAATLGIKLGTVRSRIHRGRAQLRGALPHRSRGESEGESEVESEAVSEAESLEIGAFS